MLRLTMCKTQENVTSEDEYESSDFNAQHYPEQHDIYVSRTSHVVQEFSTFFMLWTPNTCVK